MRSIIALLAVFGFLVGVSVLPLPGGLSVPGLVSMSAQQPSGGEYKVDINVDGGGGDAWWTNPVWIAVGAIGLLLLVVIIAMAMRGGGTTIIKE